MTTTGNHVKRRQVFYIPGYDPFHPRRYRELYRKESTAQAQISGYEIALTPQSGGTHFGWTVDATIDGCTVQTSVNVLVWSDIVRDSMSNSIPGTYAQLAQTAWIYISTGALFRLMRLRKGPVIAALYPVVVLLAQALLGICAMILVAEAFQVVLPAWPSVLGWGAGGFMALLLLCWFKSKDNKTFAYYLMHDYAYSAQLNGANPPELEARLAVFSNQIATALCSDVDEVLVVGHSSGAHLGVSVLADLLRSMPARDTAPAFSFLTLGHVVPMMSFLPNADRLRRDLRYLAESSAITWVDVTAPGDGCAFALCDPVSVTGVAPPAKRWPLVFSAAFTQTLSAQKWKQLRWRFFRLHFQYLCAFDRPKDYDYFQITAGPVTLGDRYANRPASRSRIEAPVNAFTTCAP